MDVVDRYLELGLRLGRHVDGLVDSYYGPAELAERVAAEEVRPAEELAADAETLRADVAASDLDPQRRGWLDDQLLGVSTYASVLAGERIAYADEVERCFGVRPERIPEERFAAAQERMDELLPGDGSLAERLEAWRQATVVPADVVSDAFAAVSTILREETRRRFGLPQGEDVEIEIVRDEPWLAYNYYLGELRSRIAVNVDRPLFASAFVDLVAHEAYPGHHTEHASKEHRLVGAGVLEESLLLVPTPQSMVSEGIAENAWDAIADAETAAAVADALAGRGVLFDVGKATALGVAGRDLRFVGSNAALLLHEDGALLEEAQAYVERWAATTPARAASSVRFVSDPLWRAYASTYSFGGALCRRYLEGRSERFSPLLTRQTRVADLAPALSSAP